MGTARHRDTIPRTENDSDQSMWPQDALSGAYAYQPRVNAMQSEISPKWSISPEPLIPDKTGSEKGLYKSIPMDLGF